MKTLEQERKHILQRVERERKKAELLVEKISGVTCTLSRRVGEQDKLFGSVTTKDIEKCLTDQGIDVDRKTILLEEPIKSLGEFPVKIRLQPGITAEIMVMVVAENEE
jgi:large subunit ribosomal protein L9